MTEAEQEDFEERAAIMEEGCKCSREKADYMAMQCINEKRNEKLKGKHTAVTRVGIRHLRDQLKD